MTATAPRRILPERWNHGFPRSRGLAAAEWTLLAILLAIFVGRGFVPAWRTLNTDFPNYYLAAVLHHKGIPLDRAYEWIWFQRQKDHQGIEQPLVGFMPNPPMCAAPMLPLATLQPLAAKRLWLSLNVMLLLLALWILHRVTNLSWRRIFLVSFLCITPLQTNFICGQYYVIILVLICGAYYASLSNHRFTSGLLLSAAASLKLFPALFLILFIRKRDWRSAAGLVLGGAVLAAISVAIFGWEVHRVWLTEVLPRASRGDIIDPYAIQWNSFSTIWHKTFLFEPTLNPSPLFNSAGLYAFAQATTATLLVFSYLVVFGDDREYTPAMDWAALVSLLLLLSSMPSSYHCCVLIFAAVVACDAVLKKSGWRAAVGIVFLFAIVCAPVPGFLGRLLTLRRLLGNLGLYLLLLCAATLGRRLRVRREWLGAAVFAITVLTLSNWSSVRHRGEDFARRISFAMKGYSANNPVPVGDQIVFTTMLADGYSAVALQNSSARNLSLTNDVLAIAGSTRDSILYAEQVRQQSSIVRLPLSPSSQNLDSVGNGESPSVSPDGKWLAFVREEQARATVWLVRTGGPQSPQPVADIQNLLDLSISTDGDLIAAVGAMSNPYLIRVRHGTNAIEPMTEISGPVRYPAVSPDGTRLAFSRRENGSWQLVVYELGTGAEHQLTDASCNATSPSWENSHVVLYATDCGRGLGLNALARVTLPN
jgi:Tol biopolymer transport system component